MTYRLGIIGHGFVGKAIDHGFSKDVEKKIIDPIYKTSVADLEEFAPQAVFVAVPTPMGEDGAIDATILLSVVRDVAKLSCAPILIIKSTVIPQVLQECQKIYTKLVFNPEFMRERNYKDDFVNPSMVVLGGERNLCETVNTLYENHSICNPAPVHYCDIIAASMLKYTLNSFLATKVLFFNQLKDVFDAAGSTTPWETFTAIVAGDSRIGSSHMSVPGPDGRKGFGGACFAKDTSALAAFAKSQKVTFHILTTAISDNQKIRKQYADLDEREKQQKVKYNLDN